MVSVDGTDIAGSLIRVRHLNKQYRRGSETIDVLQGLNLDVSAGEFVAFMGPSGTGKTTLLNLLGGLDVRTPGSATVDGDEITSMSARRLSAWAVPAPDADFAPGIPNFSGKSLPHMSRQGAATPPTFPKAIPPTVQSFTSKIGCTVNPCTSKGTINLRYRIPHAATAPAPPPAAMINAIINYCARNKSVVLIGALFAAVGAWYSITNVPLDAIPDLSDTQVILFTEWMGRSPDLVEDQITYPITTALLSAPHVTAVRGYSMFGMSFIYVIFDDGTDIYWARSRSKQVDKGYVPPTQ